MKPKDNIATSSLKFVLVDLIGDILYWPLWWYSKGLVKSAHFFINEIRNWEELLGVKIWLKNIFTPMYGQYDWEGRIISFFIRIFQIIFRTILLLMWTIFMLILFLAWIIGPIYVFYQFIDNIYWLN